MWWWWTDIWTENRTIGQLYFVSGMPTSMSQSGYETTGRPSSRTTSAPTSPLKERASKRDGFLGKVSVLSQVDSFDKMEIFVQLFHRHLLDRLSPRPRTRPPPTSWLGSTRTGASASSSSTTTTQTGESRRFWDSEDGMSHDTLKVYFVNFAG